MSEMRRRSVMYVSSFLPSWAFRPDSTVQLLTCIAWFPTSRSVAVSSSAASSMTGTRFWLSSLASSRGKTKEEGLRPFFYTSNVLTYIHLCVSITGSNTAAILSPADADEMITTPSHHHHHHHRLAQIIDRAKALLHIGMITEVSM